MKKKPNILIYMTDQQRATSVYPYSLAKTPNIDRFATEGLCFSQMHTTAPHCCPARASLWSGLYPTQHGVWNNVSVGNALSRGLYDNITLFPELFQQAGYRTYYTGKWHISDWESPCDRGFDMYTKECDSTNYGTKNYNVPPPTREWEQYRTYKTQTERKPGQILRRGYNTYTHYFETDNPKLDYPIIEAGKDILRNRVQTDETHQIDKETDAPWFQVISTNAPHDPYGIPQKYLDLYQLDEITLPESFYDTMEDKPSLYRKTAERFRSLTPEEYRESLRHYLAACSFQDDMFGQVLAELEQTGERENTIVLYLSDHGDYMGDHGLWCKGLPCFEGAYHIPCIMRWPEGITEPNRVVTDFTCITDIAPTLLDLCDISYTHKMQGTSLSDYVNNITPKVVQTTLYTQTNGNEIYGIQRSVRTKDWKYVYNGFDYDELYDLKHDPNEMKNLYQGYKDSAILKELSKKMWSFACETGDVCVNPYIMVALSSYGPGILFEDEADEALI